MDPSILRIVVSHQKSEGLKILQKCLAMVL